VAPKGALQDFTEVETLELICKNNEVIQLRRDDADTGNAEVKLFDFVLVVLEVVN